MTSFADIVSNEWSGIAQWLERLARNESDVSSSYIKGSRCNIVQEALPLLLSTGWFQEQIRVWFRN